VNDIRLCLVIRGFFPVAVLDRHVVQRRCQPTVDTPDLVVSYNGSARRQSVSKL